MRVHALLSAVMVAALPISSAAHRSKQQRPTSHVRTFDRKDKRTPGLRQAASLTVAVVQPRAVIALLNRPIGQSWLQNLRAHGYTGEARMLAPENAVILSAASPGDIAFLSSLDSVDRVQEDEVLTVADA